MRPFFLSPLSTPPTPQEAGLPALTSHLADIRRLETSRQISFWGHQPPPSLWGCSAELLEARGSKGVKMPSLPVGGEKERLGRAGRKSRAQCRESGKPQQGLGGEHAECSTQGPGCPANPFVPASLTSSRLPPRLLREGHLPPPLGKPLFQKPLHGSV